MKKTYSIVEKVRPPVQPLLYILLILISSVLNVCLSWINNSLHSPLFMDSIFTAVSAVLYGPAAGALTGLLTNTGIELVSGMTGYYWPFALCNMATGLILGLMSRKGFFTKGIHLTLAILILTLANAVLGALTAYFVFGGDSGVSIDVLVSAFTELGQSLFSAAFLARIPTNLIDKMITVYIAYGFYKVIGRNHPPTR